MTDPFFFLHLPRTAGTTLNAVLESNFAPEEVLSIYSRDEYLAHRHMTEEELRPIRLITGHLLLETTNPPTIYGRSVRAFTFLREPVARLVSEYDFLRSWKENHLYALLNDNGITFAEYIASTEKGLFYRGKNFMTRMVSGVSFQDEPYPEEALRTAKENLEKHFSFLGLQERFFESLVMLGDFLGLSNILHEKRNSLVQESKTILTEDDIALARSLNRADLELYAFAADLFEQRVAALGAAFGQRVRQFEFLNTKFQKVSALLSESAGCNVHGSIRLPKDGLW